MTKKNNNNKKIKFHLIERRNSLEKQCKQTTDDIFLVFNYYLASSKNHEILRTAHRHTLNTIRLSVVLPSPSKVAFQNPKTLRDRLVRSKI